jgi:capsid assembly protease
MSMAAFARDVAARLHHRGCLISPDYPDVAADLREIARTDLAILREAQPARLQELATSYGLGPIARDKPFAFSNGVAVIPIHGILLGKMSWGSSYATGYNYIRDLYHTAVADPEVQVIVYDVNSPGGHGAGCGELAAELAARGKPSLAVVDARAYSAAYWLASAADHIAVTPSGGAGSIGVVAMHVDYSKALEQEGIAVTFIIAGAEKVDGNAFEPLAKRARTTIQRDVDHLYGLFVGAVASNRDLDEDDVRATEARAYLPDEAQELGLIDSVATPAAALAQFLDRGRSEMPTENTDAIRTAVEQALRADRERAAAIRTCTEAAGKRALAEHLASNTDVSVDVARSILGAATPEPAAANPNGFVEAMNRTPNPNVGADNPGDAGNGASGEPGGGDDTPVARANRILGAFGRMTGEKIKTIEHEAA